MHSLIRSCVCSSMAPVIPGLVSNLGQLFNACRSARPVLGPRNCELATDAYRNSNQTTKLTHKNFRSQKGACHVWTVETRRPDRPDERSCHILETAVRSRLESNSTRCGKKRLIRNVAWLS